MKRFAALLSLVLTLAWLGGPAYAGTVTVLARLSLTTLPIRVRLRDGLASVMVTP